ncbi:TIGR04086 family membrane protein [Salirhabdus salicampi]|uniref:TIGR04086 family membrane protein n=1 Tax=Salirhabdus salicampi TaxID=476102 RepID=UPI0020C435F5|nr:TIGR04086 family membrane protein [Salirhabdus salicampi]MCP8616986.1 TIGR04086 family membrane protein [Salirhabdus salicampi]
MMTQRFTALLFGWVTVFALMLVSSFILALIIRFAELQATTLHWVTFGLGILYLFLGGLFAGVKGKEKGWILGGLTGLGYSLFILLYQFLAHNHIFHGQQWIYHGLFILVAAFGGIFGVNLMKSDK